MAAHRVVRAYHTRRLRAGTGAGVHHHPVAGGTHERVGAPPVRLYLVAAQFQVHETAGAQHAAAGRGRFQEPRETGAPGHRRRRALAAVVGGCGAVQGDHAARAPEPPAVADGATGVTLGRRYLDERVLAREPEVPVVLRDVHVVHGELDAHGRARVRLERERGPERRARAPDRQLDARPRVVRDGDARLAAVRVARPAEHAPRPVRPGVRLGGARGARGRVHPGHGHADALVQRRGRERECARQVPAAAAAVEEHVLGRPEAPGAGAERAVARGRAARLAGPRLPPLRRLVHELVAQQEMEREQHRALFQVDLHRQLVRRRRVRLQRGARPHVPGVVAQQRVVAKSRQILFLAELAQQHRFRLLGQTTRT